MDQTQNPEFFFKSPCLQPNQKLSFEGRPVIWVPEVLGLLHHRISKSQMKWMEKVIQIQTCGCTNGIDKNRVDGGASHRLGLSNWGHQQRLVNSSLHKRC